MTEQLSPETLRQRVADLIAQHVSGPNLRTLDVDPALHRLDQLTAAEAIIPLIYTAGRRAGREEAAKVADTSEARLADMWGKTYALREMLRVQLLPGSDALRPEYNAANDLHYLVGGRGNVAAAIRNLDKQDEGRG